MVDMNYPNNRQFQNPGPQPIHQEQIPEEPKRNGWLIFTSILCIALIFTVGILAYTINVIRTQPNNQSLNLNQNTTLAFNQGVVASIIQLMKSTDSCQVASIKYYNATRQIVDINCVRQLLQQQNITLK